MACKARSEDEKWMRYALDLARESLNEGEFPVGCVLVANGEVLGKGRRVNSFGPFQNELDHAEMRALADMSGSLGPTFGLVAYSTLEPCLMCLGGLVLNGVRRIVYAYEDVMGGACGLPFASVRSRAGVAEGVNFYGSLGVEILGGLLREESRKLLAAFFSDPDRQYWRDSPLAHHALGSPL